jgi:hypothetical protein
MAMNRMLGVVLMMTWSVAANAICRIDGRPWPTVYTPIPDPPVAGSNVVLVLGPPAQGGISDPLVTLAGNVIEVRGFLADGSQLGIPPPFVVQPLNLGVLPAGEYRIRFDVVKCMPFEVPLSISGVAPRPASDVPISRTAMAILCGSIMLFGIAARVRCAR